MSSPLETNISVPAAIIPIPPISFPVILFSIIGIIIKGIADMQKPIVVHLNFETPTFLAFE